MSSESGIKNSQTAMPQLEEVLQPYMECPICFGTLHNAASCTPCLHTFCMGCITRWAETNTGKCPMCRISVKEITPNWVLRDLVKNYLLIRPEQKRQQRDMELLDQAELEYVMKWLGSTDDRILQIESMASLQGSADRCDEKYNNMMTRAVELIGSSVCKEGQAELNLTITKETIKSALEMLLQDLHKEILPMTIFTKYHRLERAYRKLVKISMPMIGQDEHTWLGNYFFDNEFKNGEANASDEESSDDEGGWDPGMSARISGVISNLRNRRAPPRAQLRARVRGYDPVDLEAMARVQTMRAPGFRRQPSPPVVEPTSPRPSLRNRTTLRHRNSNNSTGTQPSSTLVTLRRTGMQSRVLFDAPENPPAQNAPAANQPPVRRSARIAANLQHN